MKKPRRRRLGLNCETIRSLDDRQFLGNIQGGASLICNAKACSVSVALGTLSVPTLPTLALVGLPGQIVHC